MTLALIGVNHKTAPIELRERIAISREDLPDTTRALAAMPGVSECMIVSTCNRVELLAAVDSPTTSLTGFLESQFGIEAAQIEPHIYEYRDTEAVNHLFRMAASLDSMVVGEPQILGQVKEAFAVAKASGTVAGQLEHLLQSAFAAAKKARSETGIGSNSVSIASVAVDLARKIFGSLQGRTVFLVGAGKMSELAARHLVQQGAGAILVTNRTHERARRMAEEFQGAVVPQVVPFEKLYEAASSADIVISSTGAPHHIFRPEHGQAFLHRRRNRPMFFIDIAVPRDVDPAMNKLDGIFVYDIDDLQQVAAAHMEERSREAMDAETLIAVEVERFQQRQRTVNLAPAIVALQRKAEEIRQGELHRIHARLGTLTPEQVAAVEALTRGLVNKFLHPPMQAIKQAAREGDSARLDALCEAWSVSVDGAAEADRQASQAAEKAKQSETAKPSAGKSKPAERGGSPMKLRIGSRGSQLALWQANHIAGLLRGQGHDVEIEIIKTTGDRLQEVTFAQVGSKGMFTKEIEEALAEGRVDLAVHSLKDLPTELPEPFALAATPPRVDPRDAFVSVNYASLAALPQGAKVGTSSQRRRAQLKALRPDIEAVEFRGNVDTRLRKLAEGQVDAILLASAGLERLGKTDWVRERLDPKEFCPAAGQGALGIETRKGDEATIEAFGFPGSWADPVCRDCGAGCAGRVGRRMPGADRDPLPGWNRLRR